MSISMEKLEEIISISQLSLTEGEKAEQIAKINDFLKNIEVLEQLDTSLVEPLNHVQPLQNVLRKDQLKVSLTQERALENALEKEDGMFKVPKII